MAGVVTKKGKDEKTRDTNINDGVRISLSAQHDSIFTSVSCMSNTALIILPSPVSIPVTDLCASSTTRRNMSSDT